MKLKLSDAKSPESTLSVSSTAPAEIVEETREIIRTQEGLAELERILSKTATPRKLKRWLLEICQAEDVRLSKTGTEYRTPNWEARIKGLDRVMTLLRYTNKDATVSDVQPTKIVIQVIEKQEIKSESPRL